MAPNLPYCEKSNWPSGLEAVMQHDDDELAEAILGYLAERPQAADTLEGIAEWWLLRQQVRVVVARVERVLGRLTACGILEETGTGDSRRYRVHPPLLNEGRLPLRMSPEKS
jgi:hypothetical protein